MANKAVDRPRTNVRMHPDTKARVEYWAKKRGVSMN